MHEQNLIRLKKLSKIINIGDDELELLANHKRVSYQELDVGGTIYPAWRILHNEALGPGKGGIRFHPQVSEDEVKSLSFWMSLKNSLVGLPYGGGKGGIKFNPKEMSDRELEKISRAYARAFSDHLGQDKDIPAPDVYTNAQVMSWMLDEYEKQVGHHEPGMITGKPLELGGCSLRPTATADGGFIVFEQIVKDYNLDKSKLKIAVQGFGNAGYFAAKNLHDNGYKVVAVSDSRGGVFDENGLDVEALKLKKDELGSVVNSKIGEVISNKEILELDVDVLFLAALENQITEKNAKSIKAQYIIELANGPIDEIADEILFDRSVVVVPDILANAGGVTVSYFEWAQNKTGQILDREYLSQKLFSIMVSAWKNVYEFSLEKKISLRMSAYAIAVKRIIKAEKYRGNIKKAALV